MKKNKIFWIYLIIISLVYIILLYFIKVQISGSFSVENGKKINFNELPNSFNLNKNQNFLLDIDYKDGYTFSDNADLFEIEEATGIISFTPLKTGIFPVVIIAYHDVNNFDMKVVVFNVGE